MSSSRMIGCSGAVALWALVSSCSLKHGSPEAGDTVTNWLAHCSEDGDCTGGTSCIGAVCTMACSASGASVCRRMSRDAICDTGAKSCDLECEDGTSCEELGPEHRCEQGRCRAGPAYQDAGAAPGIDAGLHGSSSALATSVTIEVEAASASPSDNAFGPVVEGTFVPQAVFSPSDPATQASQPTVAWHGDHFFIGWSADPQLRSGTRADLAAIYPSGRYSVRRLEIPDAEHGIFHANGYIMAHPHTGASSGWRLTDLRTGQTSAPIRFEGSDRVLLASVPGSDDWLAAWELYAPRQPSRVVLARLRFDAPYFVAGPWEIGAIPSTDALPAAAGGDGFVRWLPGDALYRLSGLGSAETPVPDYAPRVETLQVPGGDNATIVAAAGRTHVLSLRAPTITSAVIAEDGSMGPALEIALPRAQSQSPMEGAIRAVYAPELKRLGVCAVASSGVWFVSIDEEGQRVDTPVSVEESEQAADGAFAHGALVCEIAWSGREFLIAWLDLAVDPHSTAPLAGYPTRRSLRARILSSSGLIVLGER